MLLAFLFERLLVLLLLPSGGIKHYVLLLGRKTRVVIEIGLCGFSLEYLCQQTSSLKNVYSLSPYFGDFSQLEIVSYGTFRRLRNSVTF